MTQRSFRNTIRSAMSSAATAPSPQFVDEVLQEHHYVAGRGVGHRLNRFHDSDVFPV
jgi:hypothetical protein